MTATSYIGKIQENGTVFVPKDAQEELGLQPGDEVQIQRIRPVTPVMTEEGTHPPNLKAIAALQEIAERQKNRPYSDGSDTLRLLHEGRDGTMYSYKEAEQPAEESVETLDIALASLLEEAQHIQYEVPALPTDPQKKVIGEIIEAKYRKMGFDL